MEKTVEEKKGFDVSEKELFRKHLNDECLKDGVRGSFITAASILLSIIPGRTIYAFPPVIMHLKIAVAIIVGLFIVSALAIGEKRQKLVTGIFTLEIVALVMFSMLFSIIVSTMAPEHTARAAQVTMAILLGCVLFAGAIRDRLERIITFALAGFVAVMFVINGFSVVKIFDFYMVIVCAVASAVFNRLYTESLFKEFQLRRKLSERVEQLECEVDEKEEIHAKLVEMACYDSLTKTYSRRQGLEIFERQFARCKKEKLDISVCYMDIDNLKGINDRYGHAAGDKHILKFAGILGECIRESDYCIRLGGDEFLLVLPYTDGAACKAVCRRIMARIDKYNEARCVLRGISVSHGAASIAEGEYDSCGEMIDDADMRMYKEKMGKKRMGAKEKS